MFTFPHPSFSFLDLLVPLEFLKKILFTLNREATWEIFLNNNLVFIVAYKVYGGVKMYLKYLLYFKYLLCARLCQACYLKISQESMWLQLFPIQNN
jgi:hypothetical protein